MAPARHNEKKTTHQHAVQCGYRHHLSVAADPMSANQSAPAASVRVQTPPVGGHCTVMPAVYPDLACGKALQRIHPSAPCRDTVRGGPAAHERFRFAPCRWACARQAPVPPARRPPSTSRSPQKAVKGRGDTAPGRWVRRTSTAEVWGAAKTDLCSNRLAQHALIAAPHLSPTAAGSARRGSPPARRQPERAVRRPAHQGGGRGRRPPQTLTRACAFT